MSYKYKAIFEVQANFKQTSKKALESKASIDELKELTALMPEDKSDEDLLYCSFNLGVAGLVNANDHGILPATAVSMMNTFKMKPMNIEHYRSDVVGVITNVGFSSFPENKLMAQEDCADCKMPFNMAASAVVWKKVNPWFADSLKYSNKEDGWDYKGISTSWEVGFDEYVIARGSKNLFDAEIVEDEAEVKRLSKYLRQFGGTGFDDNHKEVYMVISGEPCGIGGGFTANPAAAVSGVIVHDPEDEEEDEKEMDESKDIILKDSNNNDKKISQSNKTTVEWINMKFKNVDEFIDCYQSSASKQEVIASSAVREFIQEQIEKGVEGWKSQVDERDAKISESASKISDLQAALDVAKDNGKTLSDSVESLKSELADIKAEAAKAKAQEIFNSRMAELDEKYEMSDKVRTVIAKSIANKSDEQYSEWLSNEGEVILAGKEKKAKEVDEAVKEVKASADIVPNTSHEDKQEPKKLSASVKRAKNGEFEITLS